MAHTGSGQEVLRCLHTVACDGKYVGDQRDMLGNSIINSCYCTHVINYTALICRKDRCMNFTSGTCLNEGTLSTLRILGLQRLYIDPGLICCQLCHQLDAIRLIVLDRDHALGIVKQGDHDLKTADHTLRCFKHNTII